jgi:hypothetical protein
LGSHRLSCQSRPGARRVGFSRVLRAIISASTIVDSFSLNIFSRGGKNKAQMALSLEKLTAFIREGAEGPSQGRMFRNVLEKCWKRRKQAVKNFAAANDSFTSSISGITLKSSRKSADIFSCFAYAT